MNHIRFMTHVVVGYPTLPETITLVKTMADAGVDIVELQIPFSDPLADGPTIMRACETSLGQGTRVSDAFAIMKQLSGEVTIPLLFMAYYNTVFTYGTEKFCRDAKNAGAYGLIVPDMAVDEESHEHFIASCRKYGIHNIQVVAPSSTIARLKKNAEVASGFVYATAHQGITGAKDTLHTSIQTYLTRVKKYMRVPIAVGFGISKVEQINLLRNHADIVVIGSTIIDIIANSTEENCQENIRAFLKTVIR